MREVLPGVFHWTARHPSIGMEVSSFWLDDGGVFIDPLIPPREGIGWFAKRPTRPSAVLLSNRHHYRQSRELVNEFGVTVHAPTAGLHEFDDGRQVTGYDPGDALPGGVVAIEIGGLCPDEMALHVTAIGVLALADGIVRADQNGGSLGFVPDTLMDDPPETKRKLLKAYKRVLDTIAFEHLLLAHGGAVIGDGRAQLKGLVDSGGRTAFEL